jgi:ppGpp synthetase/RelA/SpoT-type nucleotidyltranferase/HEPN domain-containing protein
MASFTFDGLAQTLKAALGSNRLTPQIERALKLAFDGHVGQFREQADQAFSPIPYIVHPVGVALLAIELKGLVKLDDNLDDLVSVALTHDLLEDTIVTTVQLEKATSSRVVELVQALSKPILSEKLNRQERSKLALRRIIRAGRTASYIKVCDFLNNISRPNTTPPELLRKALDRGKGSYGVLFSEGDLPATLRDEFERRLLSAEVAFERGAHRSESRSVFSTFEQAVEYCTRSAQGKVLEAHDISEILKEVTSATFSDIEGIEPFVHRFFASADSEVESKHRQSHVKCLRRGQLEIQDSETGMASMALEGIRTIIALPLEPDSTDVRHFFLGWDKKPEQEWITLAVLRVLVGFLTERLRHHERGKRSSLDQQIARSALDVDADDLIAISFDEEQVRLLRQTLNWAEYARLQLTSALKFMFNDRELSKFVEVFESRTKTARSAVQKLYRRRLTSIAEVDDLVGIRIVCTSFDSVKRMRTALNGLIAENSSLVSKMQVERSPPVMDRDISTPSGYRASHLTFFLHPNDRSVEFTIGCEIQLRTLYQDAWARASHRLQYAMEGPQSEMRRQRFKKLAEISAEADRLLED